MSLQSLHSRQSHAVLHHLLVLLVLTPIDSEVGSHPQEGQHTQASSVLCSATGRQDVVGPGSVVPQDLRGVPAQEHRPVVRDAVGHLLALLHLDLEVLGPDHIRHRHRLLCGAHLHCEALGHGHACGGGRGQVRQSGLQALVGLLDEVCAGAHKDGPRLHIMLRLGEEVGSNNVRVGGIVRDHQHLGGPGQHVDSTHSAHQALGSRHPLVPGTHDDVTLRHPPDAVGQSSDGLGPPQTQHPIGSRHVGRPQGHLGGLGGGHPHGLHACGPGGDRSHEHRRGQGVPAPRGVAPCGGHG
mmetsp:Transcript_8543/g.13085  ORF Transcript_8543/g.13085 Transcript_8543/m.13085 type:complete len:297 (+) Transcript_8543:244-1134(+)